MANKEADEKKPDDERDKEAEEPSDQRAEDKGPREKRKRPEPSGNLKRRADWFKKRH